MATATDQARLEATASILRAALDERNILDHQRPPAPGFRGWLLLAGRGAGKTYAASRYIARLAESTPNLRCRIIAPTLADAIESVAYGPSGILEASPTASMISRGGGTRIEWPNGSTAWLRGTPTAREVDRLRALNNIDLDHFEEAAANPMIASVVEQCRLSRRRAGSHWIATTTPRPLQTIRDWVDDPTVHVTRASSHDNRHIDQEWLDSVDATYHGSRLYQQEVLGEIIDEVEGALWTIEHLNRSRIDTAPTLARTAVGVDPAKSTGTTGIVAVGVDHDGHIHVLEDASITGAPAERWAAQAAQLGAKHNAPIIVEDDSGGDAMRAIIQAANLDASVKTVTARGHGGKHTRAVPVALLWERTDPAGHIVGHWPKLEDELTTWTPDDKNSPDRLDAMVHAVRYLKPHNGLDQVTDHFPTESTPKPARMGTLSRIRTGGR